MRTISLLRPDDWHVHLRDGAALRDVAAHTAQRFRRALVMPNLKPPVTTVTAALAYRERILASLPATSGFEPVMALYLTESTPREEVMRVAAEEHVLGFKLYPAGATTHSEAGVANVERVYSVFEAMEEYGVPLMVHGEVTDAEADIFDRERIFLDTHLRAIVDRFPALRLVLEHATTRDAVDFVRGAGPNIAATLTVHHLLYNRNALLAGGVRPHFYCLPVLKREEHRRALVEAATSGDAKFFLGTDSAPHAKSQKETACGCAGCYTAYAALELYAMAFEQAGALDRLERFASRNGPDFYGLAVNRETVILEQSPWTAPQNLAFGKETLVPLMAGETIGWRLLGAPIGSAPRKSP